METQLISANQKLTWTVEIFELEDIAEDAYYWIVNIHISRDIFYTFEANSKDPDEWETDLIKIFQIELNRISEMENNEVMKLIELQKEELKNTYNQVKNIAKNLENEHWIDFKKVVKIVKSNIEMKKRDMKWESDSDDWSNK